MSISQRDTIISNLKTEIGNEVDAINTNYEIGVNDVLRGFQLFDDVMNKPAISIVLATDSKLSEVFNDGNYIRKLDLKIIGYCDTDGNTFDDVHKLLRDMEYYFENDCQYKDDLNINDIIVFENGVSLPLAMFEMDVDIIYNTNITSP